MENLKNEFLNRKCCHRLNENSCFQPETTEIKLKLSWNPAKDKYTVRHLKKALKAEDVREEGSITCANGAAYAIFKSDEDALDGHIAAMEFKPKPIK